MAILQINTDLLRSSVSVAEQANAAISEAASLLNAIAVHEDWICTEREKIKQMTLNNKQTAQTIEDRASSFYSAVKTASEKFDITEQNSCHKINGVDDIISKIVTTVPPITEVVHGGSGSGSAVSMIDFSNLVTSMTGSDK